MAGSNDLQNVQFNTMNNKGIIGTICGDIIGSAYEFHRTKRH